MTDQEVCPTSIRGIEEAVDIGLFEQWLTGGDVIELAVAHPLLQPTDQIEEVVERVDYEQERLVAIDFKGLIDDPFHLNRVALHFGRLDGVLEFAIGTEEPAAVGADSARLAHQPELD